jgi:DNA-binding transcriptional LysR family regulator
MTTAHLMETDLLRTFVAIADLGNFSAAAKRVHRTPSAISLQVKKLEEQLGRALFNREGRRVSLTGDGEMLLGYARQMLRLNQDAVARFTLPAMEGVVCFGSSDDFGTRFLPHILKRFSETHPQVEVNVCLGPSSVLLEEIEKGDLHIALVTGTRDGINDGVGKAIRTEKLIWIGAKGGCAHKSDVLPLSLARIGCCWRGAAVEALAEAGISHRIAYTCENVEGQQVAIAADLAVGPLPEALLTPQFERLGKDNDLPDVGEYDIRLVTGENPGLAAQAFADHVEESVSSL